MILFVFEGEAREPLLFKTIEKIFLPKSNDNIICSFGNNIYELFERMMEFDGYGDLVSVMKERLADRDDHTLDGKRSTDFAEIYLFFDYDFQHKFLELNEINRRVQKMLDIFCEETDNGKLYINYPMIESIRYTKELPDNDYYKYSISKSECDSFKQLAASFSPYAGLNHLLLHDPDEPTTDNFKTIKQNWLYLIGMNVAKANYIVTNSNKMPENKSIICQQNIFVAQLCKYINKGESVAVLNSFPIFLFEHLKNIH